MAAEHGRLGRPASPGLLVVNADDWGAEWATTDAILACFRTTRWFTSIRTVHPAFGGHGLHELLELSRGASVEIMVHPGWEDERNALRAPDWEQALSGRPLGSYAQLP